VVPAAGIAAAAGYLCNKAFFRFTRHNLVNGLLVSIGLISFSAVAQFAPAIIGGNTTVVVASETHPLAAVELAEVLATSDVPGGVVNLLTGFREELAPWLAGHMDVNALDLAGADGQVEERERLAAENVKRVVRGAADDQSPWEIASFLELKTVWHPIGV